MNARPIYLDRTAVAAALALSESTVEKLVRELNLPVRYRKYNAADIRAAMGTDKKRADGKVRFVLLRAAGDPVLVSDVPDSKVISVLESLRE